MRIETVQGSFFNIIILKVIHALFSRLIPDKIAPGYIMTQELSSWWNSIYSSKKLELELFEHVRRRFHRYSRFFLLFHGR